MSWQLASFAILALVLIAGFAWYERSRPPSQVVALVAALAALAIAGRIAFAAFPNVKPTTDIVIFAGYALGGAAGFAVGALAALVSNIWFGQGPWTPWQMAGWGMCGLLGAAFALGVRNAGRLSLAAVCGFAGIAYGALLNFSLMATYGGELSWAHFTALQASAVPFDAAHAIGNVVFALVAGPAMVRMLTRFRERFEWKRSGEDPDPVRPRRGWRPALRGGAGVGVVLLAAAALATPAPAAASDVSSAAAWLQSVQNGDGGWGPSSGDQSSAEITCWAMLGLAAAGRHPLDVARNGNDPVDFLRRHVDAQQSPGDLARTILALQAAGVDPREFGGRNLISRLLSRQRDNGSYEGWPNSTAYAVIALRAAGIVGVAKSVSWLRQVQNDDGGWGDTPGSPSNADGTGAVLQTLTPGSNASARGLSYLRQTQHKGGGYLLGGSGGVNTQSTAWAIQGILAAGGNPDSFRRGGSSAPDYLTANQEPDGSFRYAKPGPETPDEVAFQTPVWVTGQVLMAASGDYLPIAAPGREPQSEPAPATSVAPFGGITPEDVPGATIAPSSPAGAAGGGSGSPLKGIAPPGQATPAAPGGGGPQVGNAKEVPDSAAPAGTVPGTEASSSDEGSSSTLGAIVAGLLAGGLLFGAAWAGRRGWMRWRYGL
ncbi:MAG TPA: prenyltransferase/squalene oxidase repeat-containing protein [Thermoanaerobaculia bacterium]|nr:prenyltransferase/squalene oxidase repeat-containing protein [Thermoanaerobaculia bacterium]